MSASCLFTKMVKTINRGFGILKWTVWFEEVTSCWLRYAYLFWCAESETCFLLLLLIIIASLQPMSCWKHNQRGATECLWLFTETYEEVVWADLLKGLVYRGIWFELLRVVYLDYFVIVRDAPKTPILQLLTCFKKPLTPPPLSFWTFVRQF